MLERMTEVRSSLKNEQSGLGPNRWEYQKIDIGFRLQDI